MKRFLTLIGLLAILGIVGIIALAGWMREDFKAGRAFERNDIPYAIIISDKEGEELHRSFDKHNREWTDFVDIPSDLQTITLLTEDRRFYSHFGVDPIGIIRALTVNAKTNQYSQGASTITQQIARKALLHDEKTIKRKLREMAVSFGIESKLKKEEILELYFNVAPYGPTLSGIKGASEYYFDKQLHELSHAEMIVLSALPKDPVRLSRNKKIKHWLGKCTHFSLIEPCSPFNDKNYQQSRVEKILFLFAEKKGLSEQETEKIWQDLYNLTLPDRKNWVQSDYLHWRFFTESFLKANNLKLSEYPGGLRIQTSLDKELQDTIYSLVRESSGALLEKYNIENFAVLVLENETRTPLVWIGSKQYWNDSILGQIDILNSRRQVGSTMKPFVYSQVVEDGYDPQTIFWDTRVRFKQNGKIIENADGYYAGAINMEQALSSSRNVPAAQAFFLGGGEKRLRKYMDERFGFGINEAYNDHIFGWTLSLGTAPIRPHTLANAYATLATGNKRALCPIVEIETITGDPIPALCNPREQKVMYPDVQFLISKMLSNQYTRTFGNWKTTASLAIKTGTSTKRVRGEIYPVDNFVVGYTPNVTVLIWGGNSSGSHLNKGSFGSTSVGPLWREIVLKVFEKYPEYQGDFEQPVSIIEKEGSFGRVNGKTKYKIPNMIYVTKEENARRAAQNAESQ